VHLGPCPRWLVEGIAPPLLEPTVQGWHPLSLNMEREICGAGMLAAAVVVTIFRMAKNTQK